MQNGVEVDKVVGLAAILVLYRRQYAAAEFDKKRLERSIKTREGKPAGHGGRGRNLYNWKRGVKELQEQQDKLMGLIGDTWEQLDGAVAELATSQRPGYKQREEEYVRRRRSGRKGNPGRQAGSLW